MALTLKSLDLYSTGTYNDIVRRSNKTMLSGDIITNVVNHSNKGRNLSNSALSQVASQFIAPSEKIDRIIQLPNTMANQRYRFVMVFEEQLPGGISVYRRILYGYTDVQSREIINGQVKVDDSTIFYFTGLVNLRIMRNPQTGFEQVTVLDTSELLINENRVGMTASHDIDYALRPADVLDNLATSRMLMNVPSSGINDSRATFEDGVLLLQHQRKSPTGYLSTLLGSTQRANLTSNPFLDENASVFDEAAGQASDGYFSDHVVLKHLSEFSNIKENTSMAYYNLVRAFPYVDSVTTVLEFEVSHAKRMNDGLLGLSNTYMDMAVRGESHGMEGASPTTLAVARIKEVLPSLLITELIGEASFVITNMTTTGQPEIRLSGNTRALHRDLPEAAIPTQWEKAKVKMFIELLPGLTSNNMIPIYVDVYINVNSELRVGISWDGRQKESYTLAIMASNRDNGNITRDMNTMKHMVYDVSNLSSNLFTELGAGTSTTHQTRSASPTPSVRTYQDSILNLLD